MRTLQENSSNTTKQYTFTSSNNYPKWAFFNKLLDSCETNILFPHFTGSANDALKSNFYTIKI